MIIGVVTAVGLIIAGIVAVNKETVSTNTASTNDITDYEEFRRKCKIAIENLLKSKGLNSKNYKSLYLGGIGINQVFNTSIFNDEYTHRWKYFIYGNIIPGTVLIFGTEEHPFSEDGSYILDYAYILNIYSNESDLIYWFASGYKTAEMTSGFDKLKSESGLMFPNTTQDTYQYFDIDTSKFGNCHLKWLLKEVNNGEIYTR